MRVSCYIILLRVTFVKSITQNNVDGLRQSESYEQAVVVDGMIIDKASFKHQ